MMPMFIAVPKVAIKVVRSHSPSHFARESALFTRCDGRVAARLIVDADCPSRLRRRSSSASICLAPPEAMLPPLRGSAVRRHIWRHIALPADRASHQELRETFPDCQVDY
jgi:hypothetical protein